MHWCGSLITCTEVAYLRDRKVIWSSRAVVGQPYRKTPVFRSEITHLVLNPSWTIPPTILRDDVLPAVQKNTKYLQQHHITVLDRNGKTVDPSTVDWLRYRGPEFPYSLRQEPGLDNALGQIKFMFPNPHFTSSIFTTRPNGICSASRPAPLVPDVFESSAPSSWRRCCCRMKRGGR